MKARIVAPLVMIFIMLSAVAAMATPSKIIWIPSTDIQPFMVGHIDIDNYIRGASNSQHGRDPNMFDMGFRLGVLPWEKVQMELGFDFLAMAADPNDEHPWSGNVKLGTPEDSICKFSPAIAVGLYNARATKDVMASDAPKVVSGQNIIYGLVSRTVPEIGALPSLGRFSVGYYRGTRRALVDDNNKADNDGLLLSWDRTMTEIHDHLWFAIDYMGGGNVDGSVNFGFAWRFTNKISVTFGYDVHTRKSLAGENTLTTQLDLNFP